MRFFRSKKVIIILILVVILLVRHFYNNSDNVLLWTPDIKYQDITSIIEKEVLTEEDYITIFNQTGISPNSVNEILKNNDISIIKELNTLYFDRQEIEQKYLCFPFTTMEYNVNESTPIVPLKDGDILINFSTSTLDWRHGHSALVIDAENDKTIEHTLVGAQSHMGTVSSWGKQPKFVVLRYEDEEVINKVVEFAKENLIGVDYDIFVGIDGKKDKSDEKRKYASNCSHIVWQAFKSQGIDIDSNGGVFVTPNDIALSNKLKVVQIMGIDTTEYIDRLLW